MYFAVFMFLLAGWSATAADLTAEQQLQELKENYVRKNFVEFNYQLANNWNFQPRSAT